VVGKTILAVVRFRFFASMLLECNLIGSNSESTKTNSIRLTTVNVAQANFEVE
jgi:hypothetical protein